MSKQSTKQFDLWLNQATDSLDREYHLILTLNCLFYWRGISISRLLLGTRCVQRNLWWKSTKIDLLGLCDPGFTRASEGYAMSIKRLEDISYNLITESVLWVKVAMEKSMKDFISFPIECRWTCKSRWNLYFSAIITMLFAPIR